MVPRDGPDLNARLFREVQRRDPYIFADKAFATLRPTETFRANWHLRLICDHLEQVRRGEITRLIINTPPRSLKSHLVSVAFPAFVLGHDPSARIIGASYGASLADKFGAYTRSVMQSAWYRQLFPDTRLDPKMTAAGDFATTRRGGRLAVSRDGAFTGFGGDLILIDDPLKASDARSDAERGRVNAWFTQNVIQRLDDKTKGAVVVVMQRLHEDDLTGNLLEKGGWTHLKLAAIAEEDERYSLSTGETIIRRAGEALHPEREPLETLEKLKRDLGPYAFAGQYQQEPAPREGGLVQADWFPRKSADGVAFNLTVQSWDTAIKTGEHNDWSVCTTWGRTADGRYYLLDVHRAKLTFPELIERMRLLYRRDHPDNVLVEDGANGPSLQQALTREGELPIVLVKPKGDKEERLILVTGLIHSGYVVLPKEAPWLDDFLLEITYFPNARHDDQVDSFAQALNWMRQCFQHQFW